MSKDLRKRLEKQLEKEVGKIGRRPVRIRTILIIVAIIIPVLVGVGILSVFLGVFAPQLFLFPPPAPAELESGYAQFNLKDAPTGNDLGTLNIDLYYRVNESYWKTIQTKTTFFIETRAFAYINVSGYNVKTVTVHVSESSSAPRQNSHSLVSIAPDIDITFTCLKINETFGSFGVSDFASADRYIVTFILENTNINNSWGDVSYALNGTLKTSSVAYIQQIKRAGGWIGLNTTGTIDNITINSIDYNSSLLNVGEAWILPIYPLSLNYGITIGFTTDVSITAIYIFSGIIDNLTATTKSLP